MQYAEFTGSTTRLVTDGVAGWRMLDDICQLKPGELVPGTRYELRKWVGEGGMGHVFEAVHVDIERPVALKVMKSQPGQAPGLPELFLREARACAKVESRFVVKVMDFGELPDGRPFFVMELLGRKTVHSAIESSWMSFQRALPILRQCCKALAAIHEAGLVHRDIKPRNVALLQEDGRKDTIRIVDFGLATAIGSTPRTCGTAAYMAPEQVAGDAMDARADIYALGCMAYEMLTGRPPFVGSFLSVLQAHLTEQAPRVTMLCPTLPAAVGPILLRCLEKEPELRWANPHELEAALLELQISLGFITPWDDLPMPMVDEPRRAQLGKSMPRPRRRAAWVVPAGLGTMLMLGTTMGLVIADRDGAHGSMAHLGDPVVADNSDHSARIEALTNETRLAASKAYWVYPIGDDPKQATALHWIRVLESEPGPASEQALARASRLRAEIAETLVRLGDRYWGENHGRSFALEYYAMAMVFEPELSLDDERNPLTQVQLADLIARAERGEFNTAELRAAKAIAILADDDAQRRKERLAALVAAEDSMLSLRATEQLTDLVGADDQPTPEQHSDVREADTSAADRSERHPSKAAALVEQARAAAAKGDRAGARRAFNEAIEADSRSVDALSGLAELHFEAGEYSKALGLARKASRLRPNDGNVLILLGDCYLKTLRYTSARDVYEDAKRLGHPQARARLANLDALAD